MESGYRKKLIAAMTFLGGIYFFLEFILPESFLKAIHIAESHDSISEGFVAIGLVTFGLGIINLLMIHGARIAFLKKGWSNSLALLIGLFGMIGFSLLDWKSDAAIESGTRDLNLLSEFSRAIIIDQQKGRNDVPAIEVRVKALTESSKKTLAVLISDTQIQDQVEFKQKIQEASKKLSELENLSDPSAIVPVLQPFSEQLSEMVMMQREILRTRYENNFGKKGYRLLFDGLFISLGSAMFSLLGVYIAAAAYRAFRIKSFESSLMMLAALIVMLGQIPFGLWIYEGMPDLRAWLLEVPNSAASRAIRIGASIAGLVLAFRMWFSIESSSFGKETK